MRKVYDSHHQQACRSARRYWRHRRGARLWQHQRFLGYRRTDGRAGTRNYIAILSTVNCLAAISRAVAAHFKDSESLRSLSVDGGLALTSGGGCAIDIESEGFVFMDSPGYDPVSVCGQIASGATLICFTAGHGPVSGLKPATKREMCLRLQEDMDINCGGIVDGLGTVAQAGERISEAIIQIASGSPSKSEGYGYGDNGFVAWPVGAVTWSDAALAAGGSARCRFSLRAPGRARRRRCSVP